MLKLFIDNEQKLIIHLKHFQDKCRVKILTLGFTHSFRTLFTKNENLFSFSQQVIEKDENRKNSLGMSNIHYKRRINKLIHSKPRTTASQDVQT